MPLSISHHFVVSIAMRHSENTSPRPLNNHSRVLIGCSPTQTLHRRVPRPVHLKQSPHLHDSTVTNMAPKGTRPRLVPPHNIAWHPPSSDHYIIFSPCSQGFKRLRSASLHTDGAILNLLLPITQAQRLTYRHGYLPCLLLQPESSRQLSFIT